MPEICNFAGTKTTAIGVNEFNLLLDQSNAKSGNVSRSNGIALRRSLVVI